MSYEKIKAYANAVPGVPMLEGEYRTEKSAIIKYNEAGKFRNWIRVTINEYCFQSGDLREAAEVFNTLADALEKKVGAK